jgi:hypothetical protein
MLFPQTNKSEVISEFEKNCVKIFPFSHCLLNDNEASDNTRHVTKGGPGVAQAPPKIIVPPRVPLQILGPIQYIIVR